MDEFIWQKPIPQGSLVNMQKQDPSVPDFYRKVWVPVSIKPGPCSEHIKIEGMGAVGPSDEDNNYIYNPASDAVKFDAVNSFAIINHVKTMYERALIRMNEKSETPYEFKWQWGGDIKVYPRGMKMKNAYYSRGRQCINMGFFEDNGNMVYNCRSFDILAHECGHAILDAIRPDYFLSRDPQPRGIHEAFGDLTAIFAILEFMDNCERLIVATKCDLHTKGWFTKLAEQFGNALGKDYGLRYADNDKKIDEVTSQPHDLSQVLTGAVFDAMVGIFELTLNVDKQDPTETLYNTARHFNSLLITAILNGPEKDATFRDIATGMMEAEKNHQFRSIIMTHFQNRKIFSDGAKPINSRGGSTGHICDTMSQLMNTDE